MELSIIIISLTVSIAALVISIKGLMLSMNRKKTLKFAEDIIEKTKRRE
jgi:hypothetical protein